MFLESRTLTLTELSGCLLCVVSIKPVTFTVMDGLSYYHLMLFANYAVIFPPNHLGFFFSYLTDHTNY